MISRHLSAFAAVLLALGAAGAHAQNRITATPNPSGAAARANAGTPGAGTTSATNPSGFQSSFPGGLQSSFPTDRPAGSPVSPSDAAIIDAPAGSTGVMGGPGVPATPQSVPSGPSGHSNVQIAASFRQADANLDGQLTRAEAQRLTIMPASFEEMDRNKDGVLSRSEYEDGLR